jgi:predicted DNA-binding transcriptional regulator AlpA
VTSKQYITRKKILERFGGISVMTLWRWEHDEKLCFPTATEINGRKYYDLAEIEAWERKRAAAPSHVPAA